jgi:hypothetical protein
MAKAGNIAIVLLVILTMAGPGADCSRAQTADKAVSRETELAIESLEAERAEIIVQIKKCEKTIANAKAIVAAANEKGKSSAAEIATKASITAENARLKYENTLQMIDGTLASLKRAKEPLSEQEKRRAKARLAANRLEISKLQGLLRACIEETTKSAVDRERLEKQIEVWYDLAVKTAQNDLLAESVKFSLLRGLNKINKDALAYSADLQSRINPDLHPLIKSQYLETIKLNSAKIERVEIDKKLVQNLSETHSFYEFEQWRKTAAYNPETLAKAADMISGIMFQYYGWTKIGVIGWLGVLSEVSAWEDLRGIDKKNAACSDQLKPIAERMESRVNENHCLEGCLETLQEGCVDKCRGKISPSAPPALQ